MKKSILASSIAAAVFGLGAVGGAQAAITSTPSSNGVGDILLVPYYSAQDNNATLLSIINTDTQSGKAVKVRFRGAANSDDVFDFQVFLSPKDVWTASVSKGANGVAQLTTTDVSCTKPAPSVLNSTPFQTGRLNSALTGDALANGTREGYIEIIGMANIPPHNRSSGPASLFTGLLGTASTDAAVIAGTKVTTDNALFTAIKHVKDVAPCTGTAWTNLDTTSAFALTNTAAGTAAALGLTPMSGGLMANWTIVNTVNAASFGGEAVALTSNVSNRTDPSTATLNVIYAPQISTATGQSNVTAWSADPLFLSASAGTNQYNLTTQALTTSVGTAPVFAAGYYDLPDLSTPIDATISAANAASQVNAVTTALATRASIINEFAVESAISGSTDWVFSMPTRRYSVAMAYSKISATDDGRRWNSLLNTQDGTTVTNVFQASNTSVVNGLICVTGANPSPTNREETSLSTTAAVVVSPSTVAGSVKLCGETSVLSFNQGASATSASLRASVAVTNIDVTYPTGWATMSVAAPAGGNYPIAGGVFQRAAFGAQGFGIYRPFR